jgi:hypothetical protein
MATVATPAPPSLCALENASVRGAALTHDTRSAPSRIDESRRRRIAAMRQKALPFAAVCGMSARRNNLQGKQCRF